MQYKQIQLEIGMCWYLFYVAVVAVSGGGSGAAAGVDDGSDIGSGSGSCRSGAGAVDVYK